MSGTENKNQSKISKGMTYAAIGAVLSILITLALMMAGAWLISSGRIAIIHSCRLVMLCVFLGTLTGTILTVEKQGRGVLTAGLLTSLMYMLLLIIFALAAGVERLFNENLIKMIICCIVGSALGGALLTNKKQGKRKIKSRKVYK